MDLAREFGQVCWRTMLASMSGETVLEWQEHFTKHGLREIWTIGALLFYALPIGM